MLLTAAVALLLALSPLLQGAWDLWAQTLLRLGGLVLAAGWLAWRVFGGTVPAPPRSTLRWAAVLGALIVLAAAASPLHALAWPDAWNALAALALLCAAPLLSRRERESAEAVLHAALWLLWSLAFYQRYFLRDPAPASALVNPNVFAGALLMALPLAWRWRDYALAAACLWALAWTRSLGAWISLSAALMLMGWRRYPPFFWTGAVAALVCGIVLYGKLLDPEFGHRAVWWGAALRMLADRPALGWGPGAFAFLLPAYRADAAGGLGSLYAHQAWLEVAVGCGLPAALLALALTLRALAAGRGAVRFALCAAALQSLGDYALLVPANLWLFAYLLGLALPGEPVLIAVPSRRKAFWIGAVGAGTLLSMAAMGALWQSERRVAQAQEAAQSGDAAGARALLESARRLSPGSPHPPLLLAQLEGGAAARERTPERLRRAAALQEEGARLNPFRPASWRDLARLRAALGDEAGAQAAIDQGRKYIPWLK